MKKICFFEFWNYGPHLETTFEIAKNHLNAGDEVHYFFGGHDTEFQQGMTPIFYLKNIFNGLYPENIGAKLIQSPNLYYHGRICLPEISWEVPKLETKEELMTLRYKNAEIGMAALSSLLDILKTEDPDINEHYRLISSALISGAKVYEFVKDEINRISPDLVYVLNGRQCRYRSVMNAAQELGVEVLFHERGHNLLHYAIKPYPFIDMIRIEDEIIDTWKSVAKTKEAESLAKDWFEGKRRGELKGWKSFVNKKAIGNVPKLNKSKRIVTFFTSSIDEQISVGDYVKWDRWSDQEHATRDLLEVCNSISDIHLVVRLHPNLSNKQKKDTDKWIQRLKEYHDLTLVLPDDHIDTYQLIQESDYIITCGSTVGIEAVYWGKISICMGPMKNHRYFGKIRPSNKDELKDILLGSDIKVDSGKALPYGYYFNTYGIKHEYYKPNTIYSGLFFGKDLRKWIPLFKRLIFASALANGILKTIKRTH